MKKLIFSFIILISCAIQIQAQLFLNVEAGANYTNLTLTSENAYTQNEPAYGYYFAMLPEYRFNYYLGLKVEAQYSVETYLYNGFFTNKATFDYFRLIPAIEIRPIKNLGINTGVNLGFKTGEIIKRNEVPVPYPAQEADETIKRDLGLLFGFNYSFGRFYFVGKYHLGLKVIGGLFVTDPTGTLFVKEDHKSQVIQFGLGYRFEVGK